MGAKNSIIVITTHILTYSLIFLLFILNIEKSLASIATTSSSKISKNTYKKKYLKTVCNSTTYPKLCYISLSPYCETIKTNYQFLCSTALNVSLQFANQTSALLTTLSNKQGLSKAEAEVIQDCSYELGDFIDELNQSLNVLQSLELNSSDVRFHISNVETWVSAALTDEDTCVDGVDDDTEVITFGSKRKIKKSILNAARIVVLLWVLLMNSNF